MAPLFSIREVAENQKRNMMMWSAVMLGTGIGLYFALPKEPTIDQVLVGSFLSVLVMAALRWIAYPMSVIPVSTTLITIGILLSTGRSLMLEAPVLPFHFYGAVQGRIIAIDRSHSNRARITLDRVRLEDTALSRTPAKVRISLHHPHPVTVPMPGQNIMITASLSPPSGPVEPGGFDFQRYAWFRSLGAVGYSRTPLLEAAEPDRTGIKMHLFALRMRMSSAIRAKLSGQTGAFAAAITTGDRSAIDPTVMKDLRASNLAHLLAISGLHMGLLTGFVFAAIRFGIALIPAVALRVSLKKVAAISAFLAALSYLEISGANIVTQRAFIMVSVMLLAVVLDRRALTLRAVAVAAIIVLVLRPESLIEAGFQMSFAATTALVAVFATMRDYGWAGQPGGTLIKRILRGFFALSLSSFVAGAATAPISAYHFNQIAQFGLLANLASVPFMGLLIVPSFAISVILTIWIRYLPDFLNGDGN